MMTAIEWPLSTRGGNVCGNLRHNSSFSGFPQYDRVYDYFPISQPRAKVQTSGGVVPTAIMRIVTPRPQSTRRKMTRDRQRLLRVGISILGWLTVSAALLGQGAPDTRATAPLITDWSHQHVIFSRPATAEQAKRVENDPRYWQQLGRQVGMRLPEENRYLASKLQSVSKARLSGKSSKLKRDWSQDLGSGAKL